MLSLVKSEASQFVRDNAHLFSASAERNPFCSPQWILLFLEQIAENDWKIIVPSTGGDCSSLMMLYATNGSSDKFRALTNYYASLFSPIIGPAESVPSAAAQLVEQITARRPRVSSVDISPVDGNAAEVSALQRAFLACGWYIRRYSCFGNWYLPCAGVTFEDYMASRDSKLRNTWIRKLRKFGSGALAQFELVMELSDVDRAMDAYEHVYARSWKKAEPYPEFVRRWARVCAQEGWLRFAIAWAGGTPIAAQFWFTLNRRAYIFKLAYDEDYASLSPGTVLTAELLRHSFDVDKVVEIDYLTGDDAYKQFWMSHRRERTGLLACNPRTARGLILSARERAGQLSRRFRGLATESARTCTFPART